MTSLQPYRFLSANEAKGRAGGASRLSAGLDANITTERSKPQQQKTAAPKTDRARCKSERNKEERETPEPATEPAARTATGETGKMDRFFIAPNVKITRHRVDFLVEPGRPALAISPLGTARSRYLGRSPQHLPSGRGFFVGVVIRGAGGVTSWNRLRSRYLGRWPCNRSRPRYFSKSGSAEFS